ncbi:MAG: right-handed parallel beta-helix repeat-containing protein [Candidatus Eisenbacteria bacterium]
MTDARCTLLFCTASAQGGGIYVDGGSPTFSYCYAAYCDAVEGGGAYFTGSSCDVQFTGGFADNTADFGAGICVDNGATMRLYNSAFVRNEASACGGGAGVRNEASLDAELASFEDSDAVVGGAIYTDHGALTLTDCWILDNRATNGAGIWCQNGSSPVLNRCAIARNYAPGYGGGIHCWNSSPDIRSSTFHDNAAGDHGNGISIEGCGLSLGRSIIGFGAEGGSLIYCTAGRHLHLVLRHLRQPGRRLDVLHRPVQNTDGKPPPSTPVL